MPKQDCLVCAADEGLFLDVFTHGKDFHDTIENYLSLEVQKEKLSSTKICYKCAYELTECNKFIEKFNRAQENTTKKSKLKGQHCQLCSEPGKKGFIYDLHNDAFDDVRTRVEDLFDHKLSSANKTLSVCLYCRYNLDVLTDLKNIVKHNSTTDAPSFKLPKVSMKVIKRKTTSIPVSRSPRSFDTDSSTTSTSKKKSSPTKSSVARRCDECDCKVEGDEDIYKFHRTGQKLCRDCWVSMNPAELAKGPKTSATRASTKSCTVVLKDVLTTPRSRSCKNVKKSSKDSPASDKKANIIYVSDDSEAEQTPRKSKASKTGGKRASSEYDTNSVKKVKRNLDFPPQRETRAGSVASNASSTTSIRTPPKRRYSDNIEAPDPEPKRLRTRTQKVPPKPEPEKTDNKKLKKEVEKAKVAVKAKAAKSKVSKKPSPPDPVSSGKESPRQSKKKTSRLSADSSLVLSQRSSVSPSHKHENEVATAEEGTRRSLRVRKSTKHLSETSNTPDISEDDDIEIIEPPKSKKKSKKSEKPKAQKSEKAKLMSKPLKSRKPVETVDVAEEDSGEERDERTTSDGDSQPYTCAICDTEFQTRLQGMTHQLTHSKKLGVVLKKVSVSEKAHNEAKEETEELNISTNAAEDSEDSGKADATDVAKDEPSTDKEKSDKKKSDDKSAEAEDQSPAEDKSQKVHNKDREVDNKSQEVDSKDQEVDSKDKEVDSKDKEVASKIRGVDGKAQEVDSKAQEADSTERNSEKQTEPVVPEAKEKSDAPKEPEDEAESEDKTAPEKSSEDTAAEKDSSIEEKKTEKSKNDATVDEADKADEETKKAESNEKESADDTESEHDNEEFGRRSPALSEGKAEESENPVEKVDHLTNGQDIETSESPELEDKAKEQEKEEEKDREPEKGKEKVSEQEKGKEKGREQEKRDDGGKTEVDKSDEQQRTEIDENKAGDSEKISEAPEAQEEETQDTEQHEADEDRDSDEEKSPEAEPLSPPRYDASNGGEPLPESERIDEKDEDETKVEGNSQNVETVKQLALNSNREKSVGIDTKKKVSVDVSATAMTKEPEAHIDEASMDAIERQMETIVGGKDHGERAAVAAAAGQPVA